MINCPDTVDGAEIPNNHRLDVWSNVSDWINCQPQLVSRISEPSTVRARFGSFLKHCFLVHQESLIEVDLNQLGSYLFSENKHWICTSLQKHFLTRTYDNMLSYCHGRNPAPPGMYETLQIMGYLSYHLVQDFFHQQYLILLRCVYRLVRNVNVPKKNPENRYLWPLQKADNSDLWVLQRDLAVARFFAGFCHEVVVGEGSWNICPFWRESNLMKLDDLIRMVILKGFPHEIIG